MRTVISHSRTSILFAKTLRFVVSYENICLCFGGIYELIIGAKNGDAD